jgi:hypothetical protein
MDFSAGTLFASLVMSTAGFGLFLYGKKELRIPQLVVGVVLMVYPYFVEGALTMWAIGGTLLLALFAAVRLGL